MNKIREYRLYICLILFWSVCLITGAFFDQDVAKGVYLKDNMTAVFMSVLGLYMVYGSFVFFLGVICRQLLVFENRKHIRLLICISCSYFALSTSTYSVAALLSDSVCGFLILSSSHTLSYYILAGIILLSFPITFSRMVLGDHYLSDISFGAITGIVIVFVYHEFKRRHTASG